MATISSASDVENQYKVRLRPANQYTGMAQDIRELRNRQVTFNVTPDVTENRNVTYKTLDPLHMPGQIMVYGGTSSRTFQLSNIRLVSRTTKEATENMRTLHMLRSWAMPYFGNSSTLSTEQKLNRTDFEYTGANRSPANQNPQDAEAFGMELLGATPDVLVLSAYSAEGEFVTQGSNSKRTRMFATNIHNIPVVVTNLTIPYPSDVDYIPAEDGQPMPRIMTLDIQLTETHSPQEYNKFSLQDFRKGTLTNF